jgi:hypothetical protein
LAACSNSAPYGVTQEQDDHRTYKGHDEAIDVQAGDGGAAKVLKYPPAHNCAHDPQQNVKEKAFSRFIDDFAAEKAGYQAQYDP